MRFVRALVQNLVFLAAVLPASRSFADACLDANIDRYLWVKGVSDAERVASENVGNEANAQRAEQVYEATKKPLGSVDGSWDRGLTPTWKAQQEALQEAIVNLRMPGLNSPRAVRAYLEANQPTVESGFLNALRIHFLESKQTNDRQRSTILSHRPIESITQDHRNTKVVAGLTKLVEQTDYRARLFYACAKMSWWHGGACSEATAKLVEEERWSGANILFPQIWLEAFQNVVFSDGLRRLALTMLQRAETPGDAADVFEDAILAFKLAGAADSAARDFAWKTMMLYGNGGQNMGPRALTYDMTERQAITAVSLSIIGTSITLLDFQQRRLGQRHYAFPRGVGGTCLSPKPYHFWAGAYQSHRLVELGVARKDAAYASMTLAKLYQVKRHLSGVKNAGIERIFVKPGTHPTLRVIRMDLTLDAAGALYGADLLNPNEDLSGVLKKYDQQSAGIPAVDAQTALKLSRDDKSAFDHWESITRSNFVFDRLLKRSSTF